MPRTRIETRRGWIGARRLELIEAVQRVLVECLKIPETDRTVMLTEYDEEAMIVPSGRGPCYLVVEITLFAGRSLDAKRRLYAGLVEELAPFGVSPQDVKTILIEVERANWGLRGLPASEIELGFKIEV